MPPPQHSRLTPEEEAFLQALLWEEGHLVQGQASRAAAEHRLPLLRALEPANRLSPNLHGEAVNRLREGPSPCAEWPWPGKTGDEVLGLLWARLAQRREEEQEQVSESVYEGPGS
jgi:hypothetical protein